MANDSVSELFRTGLWDFGSATALTLMFFVATGATQAQSRAELVMVGRTPGVFEYALDNQVYVFVDRLLDVMLPVKCPFDAALGHIMTHEVGHVLPGRISHQPSAAAADSGMFTALRSVGLLDVLSSTSAGPSVARLVSTPVRTATRELWKIDGRCG